MPALELSPVHYTMQYYSFLPSNSESPVTAGESPDALCMESQDKSEGT